MEFVYIKPGKFVMGGERKRMVASNALKFLSMMFN